MEHYFSYMIEGGRAAKKSLRLSIEESFNILWTPEHTKAIEKGTGSLMAMGYDKTKESLDERKEALFTHMSVMMIDCDNLTYDKDIMRKFEDYLTNYEYWTYESASSTPDRPKFRAIVPLDAEIEWTQFNKKAIGHLFSMFVDEGASWFEEPLLPKLNTIKHHEGKLFPAKVLEKTIQLLRADYEKKNDEYMMKRNKDMLWRMRHPDYNRHNNVSNNAKVRHYLDTPYMKLTGNGDSDSSLYTAICVCITANDESTLEEVMNKAMSEHWTRTEIERKIKQARNFTRR